MPHRLSFRFEDADSGIALTPCIDDTPLTELIARFETARKYDPAGGYAGLIPANFDYGPLDAYFRGDARVLGPNQKKEEIYLLGCSCGEVGCWPLIASVTCDGETCAWSGFRQPFRQERDYNGFGPFIFDRTQYDVAVAEVVRKFGKR